MFFVLIIHEKITLYRRRRTVVNLNYSNLFQPVMYLPSLSVIIYVKYIFTQQIVNMLTHSDTPYTEYFTKIKSFTIIVSL